MNGPAASSDGVALRWTLYTLAGEALGFSIPALAGGLGAALTLPDVAFVPLVVAAGACEGFVLSFAQSLVLAASLPGFRRGDWIRFTVTGAALAWTLGMLPSTFYDEASDWPMPLVAALVVPGALVLLNCIGVAQWLVLRHHFRRAWIWIPANAGAWVVGIGFVFLAMAFVTEETPTGLIVVAGVAGGLLMATTVAAVTGLTLAWLMKDEALAGSLPL
jgi:hypothetical protein